MRACAFAAVLVTGYYLLPLDRPRTSGAALVLLVGLLAAAGIFAWEVRTIVRSPYPRPRAVEALIVTVALYLVSFASGYYLLEQSEPGSFSEGLTRTDALYFTLTTFSTVGYGDITARSQAGRMMTMVQMTGGLVLVGVAARILAHAVETGLTRRSGQRQEPGDARDDSER
ncbi:potassium channel family protein [Streptomyces sp. NPDC127190]|uniref:potassium channel family protein n=1 Tax=unclassified Streptomyces TaxID=2593676 RepID=UPI00364257F5